MADSRTNNVKRNIIGGMLNRIITLLLPFITRTLIIYYLGALYLGLNSLFSSILNVLNLAELGFGAAMVFSMYEPIAKKDDVTLCAILHFYRRIYRMIGIFMLVSGLAVIPFFDTIITGDKPQGENIYLIYLIFLSNTVLSYLLFAYKSSVLSADQRQDVLSNISSFLSIVSAICQIIILVLFKNYLFFCLVWTVSTIANNLIVNYVVRKRYPSYVCKGKLSKAQIRDISKRVGGLFIYRLCYVFRDSFGSIVISSFIGLVALANYNNYLYITTTLTGFFAVIKSSIIASVGNSIATESVDKNFEDFLKIQFVYMTIAAWSTVVLVCTFQPFVRLWLGEEYVLDKTTMLLFCALYYFYKAGDVCAVYRQAAGLWWQDRIRPIVEAVTCVVLSIVLVKKYGVAGVLLASIFCLVAINSIWASWVLFKYYFVNMKQSSYIKRIGYYTLSTIIVAMVCGYLCDFLPFKGVLQLISCGLLSGVASIPLLYLLHSFLPELPKARSLVLTLIRKV